ncbi:MAG: DEAD/DEAH box helicase, partial [Synergistaceae bacterium]|nr:DEAD/DEAH box helicase [Synergistaceae bacterium]
MGLDVGIETGDFKRNEGARVICCTQEIYTMKYAGLGGQRLVIDEFHYIFTDPDRARTYIDGIRATHEDTRILVMSATLGGVRVIGGYLAAMAGRKFVVHESKQRATQLIIMKKPVRCGEIHDALVFLFSQRGAREMAESIAASRMEISPGAARRLQEMAEILNVEEVIPPLLKGVGVYHGGMFPKEKLLVESAFRERLLDVVCGTNALALGVNLPAQYVVFAQLVHYNQNEPISRNEFLQMAGRAGRKGLFDPGYVTWLKNSPHEKRGVKIEEVFKRLSSLPPEPALVRLRPSWGRLLRKQVLPEVEAETIAECSLPGRGIKGILREIGEGMRKIDRVASRLVHGSDRTRFRSILANIWYDEMEVDENLEMALLFFEEPTPSALMAAQLIMPYERNYLQSLLKVKRFSNSLPKGTRFRSMEELNRTVDEIDPTIYGFEEKLGEIEESIPS